MLREQEIDDKYLDKYYDSHMSLLNQGGITFINKTFFLWSKKVMNAIWRVFDEEKIDRDPHNSFEKAKNEVISDKILKSCFLPYVIGTHRLMPKLLRVCVVFFSPRPLMQDFLLSFVNEKRKT